MDGTNIFSSPTVCRGEYAYINTFVYEFVHQLSKQVTSPSLRLISICLKRPSFNLLDSLLQEVCISSHHSGLENFVWFYNN